MSARPYVAVIGPAAGTENEHRTAEEVGRLLAEAGAVVVCGGLGGVMEAAARGAERVGGLVVGILPGDDRHDANPHVAIALPTGMGEARNVLLARTADAVIAVGGEFGTLSEIALSLKLGKPVVGLSTWSLAREGLAEDPIRRASTPAEAVAFALHP
jgi:uncharacterized protein (TIGR00725 family)